MEIKRRNQKKNTHLVKRHYLILESKLKIHIFITFRHVIIKMLIKIVKKKQTQNEKLHPKLVF